MKTGEVRYLDAKLPLIMPNGEISISIQGKTAQVETIGMIIATALSTIPQEFTGLEAVCATYIAQKMYVKEKLVLTPEIEEVILKCFNSLLEKGMIIAPAHAVICWLVRPESIPENYQDAFVMLYADVEKKQKEAETKIKTLESK